MVTYGQSFRIHCLLVAKQPHLRGSGVHLVKRISAQLESGERPRNCLEGTVVAQKETEKKQKLFEAICLQRVKRGEMMLYFKVFNHI